MSQLEEELAFFIAEQKALVAKYGGKVLALKGKAVIGVYESMMDAYLETQNEHALGTFMIQPCEDGPEAYTVTLSSPGIFARATA